MQPYGDEIGIIRENFYLIPVPYPEKIFIIFSTVNKSSRNHDDDRYM